MDEKGPLCSLVSDKVIKETRDSWKDGWTESMCKSLQQPFNIPMAVFHSSLRLRHQRRGLNHCSTIFTRAGEIAVPPCLAPSRLPSPYRHAFSWAHWTVKPWDHLPPAIFCARDAPCASQTGTTAALMKESYFDSHNVCNTTQEPLSDFSTVVLNWFSFICGSIY